MQSNTEIINNLKKYEWHDLGLLNISFQNQEKNLNILFEESVNSEGFITYRDILFEDVSEFKIEYPDEKEFTIHDLLNAEFTEVNKNLVLANFIFDTGPGNPAWVLKIKFHNCEIISGVREE